MAEDRDRAGAELVADLNDLLQLDNDAVQAYSVAINTLRRDVHRETLIQFRAEHERHVRELKELIRAHGGNPVDIAHLSSGVFKLAVQALGAAGGDRQVLMAFKTNEGQVRDKYRRFADCRYPPEVADVIRRAAADEEKHYAWAAEMLAKLDAGPETTLGRVQGVVEQVQGRVADAAEGVERVLMERVEEFRRDR